MLGARRTADAADDHSGRLQQELVGLEAAQGQPAAG
jgi:hypothetical protein